MAVARFQRATSVNRKQRGSGGWTTSRRRFNFYNGFNAVLKSIVNQVFDEPKTHLNFPTPNIYKYTKIESMNSLLSKFDKTLNRFINEGTILFAPFV